MAYLVGLPPNEVPAVEIARGDLVEVTPASYGVSIQAFHFWYVALRFLPTRPSTLTPPLIRSARESDHVASADERRSGEGRGDSSGKNLYENFAETGASAIFPISEKILNLADHTQNMENEAKEEEAKDKEIQAEIVRKTSLKKRMGMTGMSGAGAGAGGDGAGPGLKKEAAPPRAERQLSGVAEEGAEEEVLADEGSEKVRSQGVDMDSRGRASEWSSGRKCG